MAPFTMYIATGFYKNSFVVKLKSQGYSENINFLACSKQAYCIDGISSVITRHGGENKHASSHKGLCASYSGFSLRHTNTGRTSKTESALVFP